MLCAVLNKSWKQHSPKQLLYGHLLPISKIIQIRRTRYAEHYCKDELIRDVRLWTPMHGCTSVGWPARTYIHQLYADTGCSLEDLPYTMDASDRWREKFKEFLAISMTWWYIYIYIYIKRQKKDIHVYRKY